VLDGYFIYKSHSLLLVRLARDMGIGGVIRYPATRRKPKVAREPSKVGKTNLETDGLVAAFLDALWAPAAAAAPSCPILTHRLLKLAANSPNRPCRTD
jgi:hypothetical protein